MATLSDEPTTRIVRPDELARLSAPAREIAEAIVELSRAACSHPWPPDAEHRVWRALHHDGPDRAALGVSFAEAARLRALADAAGGWVTWSTHPVFVERAAWLSLHRAWADQHPE